MIVIGIVGSIYFGNLTELNTVIMSEGSRAIEFTISLAAIMALWMGIMNIAKDSGLIDKIGQKMNFILKVFFCNIVKYYFKWINKIFKYIFRSSIVMVSLDNLQWISDIKLFI